jgi:hypothetical protein
MSLHDLVAKTRQLRADHPKAASFDWFDFAYMVLRAQFGVEPSSAEVAELAREAKLGQPSLEDFFQDADDCESARELQTGGGSRVLHKSEFLGG